MGLDMYLEGHKFFISKSRDLEDGYPIKKKVLDLAYWRKHPNLHGFIVEKFADGKDECQEIELELDDLRAILVASNEAQLPKTTGFFFGVSQPEDKEYTKVAIEQAIAWLEDEETSNGVWRTVIYRASW